MGIFENNEEDDVEEEEKASDQNNEFLYIHAPKDEAIPLP